MRLRNGFFGFLLAVFAAAAVAGEGSWGAVAEQVVDRLEQAADQYGQGDAKSARRAVMQAYFGVFETEKMEAAMRTHLGAQYTYMVERRFGKIRKAIKGGAGQSAVDEQVAELARALRQDARKLDEKGVSREVFRVNQ